MNRIDAHHHLWRYNAAEFGWIGDDSSSLRRDFLLDDLRRVLHLAGVDGTVAVQARQSLAETRWLLELAAADSQICGVVGWLPIAAEDFTAVLSEFAASPVLRGLRHVVQGEPAGFLDGADFNRGMRALAETDLVYDILIFAHQLEEAIRFVDRHEEQSFVLDHIAKPDIRNGKIRRWSDAIRALARRSNVCCKISGMVTEADPTRWTQAQLTPYFDVVLEAFGPERLMIGSDWPVLTVGCSYRQWWQTVESWIVSLSDGEQAQILGGTATRVYQLQFTADCRHRGHMA